MSILEAGAGELLEKRWKRQTGTATWTAAAAAAAWAGGCSRLQEHPQPHLLACPHPPPGSTLASPAAYACWREVESLLARRGSRPAATTALRQAQQTACNSAPLRYEVERLARRARLDLTERTATARTRPLADQYRLTRRGWEVLRLIA